MNSGTDRSRTCRTRRKLAIVVTFPLGLPVSVTEAMAERGFIDAMLIDDKEAVSEAAAAALEEWADKDVM